MILLRVKQIENPYGRLGYQLLIKLSLCSRVFFQSCQDKRNGKQRESISYLRSQSSGFISVSVVLKTIAVCTFIESVRIRINQNAFHLALWTRPTDDLHGSPVLLWQTSRNGRSWQDESRSHMAGISPVITKIFPCSSL